MWPQKLQGNGAVALDFSTVHHLMLSWLYNPLSTRSVVAPMPSRACVMVIGFYMHAYDPILIGLRTLDPVLYRGPEQPRDWHVLWHLPAVQVQRGLFGLRDVCMGTVIWRPGSTCHLLLVTVFGSYLEEVWCCQVFDVAILSVRKVCTCHGWCFIFEWTAAFRFELLSIMIYTLRYIQLTS